MVIILLFGLVTLAGCTPALVGSAIRGDANSVKTLLDKGTDVNAEDGNGHTALHSAAERGYVDIVKILLAKGADVNANGGGFTPLMLAANNGHAEIVKILLDNGANVNAKFRGSISIPGEFSTGGVTALIFAVWAGNNNIDVVKALLEKGADVNIKDADGNTVMDYAKKHNYDEIIKLLKEAGAKE